MRACTAVLIELSYDSGLPSAEPYRGEVEFLTAKEWSDELDALLDDLQTQDGRSEFMLTVLSNLEHTQT